MCAAVNLLVAVLLLMRYCIYMNTELLLIHDSFYSNSLFQLCLIHMHFSGFVYTSLKHVCTESWLDEKNSRGVTYSLRTSKLHLAVPGPKHAYNRKEATSTKPSHNNVTWCLWIYSQLIISFYVCTQPPPLLTWLTGKVAFTVQSNNACSGANSSMAPY